jgi:ADP-dependent NAD(P)H-hydrate dehydratase
LADYEELSESIFERVIQPRKRTSHKGDNGVVAIVGGSRIFHGAPFFSSMAALRAGADLVYLATPKSIAVSIRALTPDLIVFPLADGKLTVGAAGAFLKWLPEVDSLVLGPGIGRQKLDGAKRLVGDLSSERKVRISLDAEAQDPSLFSLLKGKQCVTTPHPGEFRRVFRSEAGETLEEKVKNAAMKARESGMVIMLKSFETVITDGEKTYVNKYDSPAMTCGGIGDTLSGVIGAFLAQGTGTSLKSVEIAAAASLAVSLAGIKAAESRGYHIVATDIIDQLPYVLKPYDKTAD